MGLKTFDLVIENDRASVRLRMIPLVDADGPAGRLLLCRDTTELRHRERQLVTKDATIREIHHRVKNNFQIVSSLLSLQADLVDSPEASRALRDAENRLRSMAVLYDKLYCATDLRAMSARNFSPVERT